MKMISKVFSCMLAFSSLLGNVEGQNIYRIWYDKPASYWEEALPRLVMDGLQQWCSVILNWNKYS